MKWKRVTDSKPLQPATCYLYRVGDLYPVVGCRVDGHYWILEEGGPEDGEHRKYPRPGGSEEWEPTHYAEIDFNSLYALRAELAREGGEDA